MPHGHPRRPRLDPPRVLFLLTLWLQSLGRGIHVAEGGWEGERLALSGPCWSISSTRGLDEPSPSSGCSWEPPEASTSFPKDCHGSWTMMRVPGHSQPCPPHGPGRVWGLSHHTSDQTTPSSINVCLVPNPGVQKWTRPPLPVTSVMGEMDPPIKIL